MKRWKSITRNVLPGAMVLFALGCSHGQKSSEDLAASGPTVVNAQAKPGTFELDGNLNPVGNTEVVADVKDFRSRVTEVKLRFIHAPIEIPMANISGTTWQATLRPEQLKTLAVSGQTMRYEANIVARNEKGQVAVSSEPITLKIKAPEMAMRTSRR